ncbi:O-antigen ligase family protein [Parvibaculum sp.]|uniref:O-antigen ligase family protein n=1 Tax=Parvibaculum sp. TaxID=2024848 RepID=UPI00349FD526
MTVADVRIQNHSVPPLRQVRQGGLAVAWPLALLTLSLFVPAQFYVDIGSFRLSAYRIVLIVILPFVTARLLGGRVQLKSYDVAIVLTALWMVLAMSVNHGFLQGLESGGIIAFETVFGYLTARLCLQDRKSIVSFVNFMILCLMAVSLVLLAEILAGRRLVYELTSWLSGHPVEYDEKGLRFGLVRAGGPFAHPIHAGVFTMVMLSFAWLTTTGYTRQLARTGILAAGTVATLSSAPLVGGVLQLGLAIYHSACRRFRIPNGWTLFFVALAALCIFLEFASNRGAVKVLVQLTALDPLTGYYRILIWTFGIENVIDNPIFGIGHGDWARVDWMVNSSVDAFWLLVAMTYGLPAVALLGYASVDIFRRVARLRPGLDVQGQNYAQAILVSLFAMIFVGFTVHYWGTAHILFLLMLGLGGAVAGGALDKGQSAARPDRYPARQTRR